MSKYRDPRTLTPERVAKIFGWPVADVRRTWKDAEFPGADEGRKQREQALQSAITEAKKQTEPENRQFFSIPELAERWRCSRGTVYNRLRKAGTKVMDWSGSGEKGKKAVRASDVYEIENRRMKRL